MLGQRYKFSEEVKDDLILFIKTAQEINNTDSNHLWPHVLPKVYYILRVK